MSRDILTRGVAQLRDWLEEEKARPVMIGEVKESDLPKCRKCGRQMMLKHSRRTNTWALKHELFNTCPEKLAPGLWRESEMEAIEAWENGGSPAGAKWEAAAILINAKLAILDEWREKANPKPREEDIPKPLTPK